MHRSEHGPRFAQSFEPGEAEAHGNGSRGLSEAAKARDDPACPSQGTAGMRVLLLCGSSFESGLLEAEGVDLVGREDLFGGDWGGAVAGVDELHDAGCG